MDIAKPHVFSSDTRPYSKFRNFDKATGDCDTEDHHRATPINMNDFNYPTDEYRGKLFDGKLRNTEIKNRE